MISGRLLRELQEVDLQLDDLARELARLEAALHEPEELQTLQTQIRHLEEERSRLQRQQRDLELDMQGVVETRTNLERRLYGGYITNPREVEAAEQKAEELRRRESTLEDRILELMVTLEDLEGTLQELHSRLDGARARWEEQRAQLLAQQAHLKEERQRLHAQRSRLVGQLPPDLLLLYERLRQRKGGVAVARLEQRVCQVCGVEVAVSVERQVRYGEEVVLCPTCGRILV